jgi:hypothetical protein
MDKELSVNLQVKITGLHAKAYSLFKSRVPNRREKKTPHVDAVLEMIERLPEFKEVSDASAN